MLGCHFTQHLDDTYRACFGTRSTSIFRSIYASHCVRFGRWSVWSGFASHCRIHSSQTLSACAGAHNGSTGSAIRSSLAPLLPVVGAAHVAVLSPPLTNRAVPLLAPLRRRQTEARDSPASASPFLRLEQFRCRYFVLCWRCSSHPSQSCCRRPWHCCWHCHHRHSLLPRTQRCPAVAHSMLCQRIPPASQRVVQTRRYPALLAHAHRSNRSGDKIHWVRGHLA